MKDYSWKVSEAQRANLIMGEENMTALENGVQVRTGLVRVLLLPSLVMTPSNERYYIETRVTFQDIGRLPRFQVQDAGDGFQIGVLVYST